MVIRPVGKWACEMSMGEVATLACMCGILTRWPGRWSHVVGEKFPLAARVVFVGKVEGVEIAAGGRLSRFSLVAGLGVVDDVEVVGEEEAEAGLAGHAVERNRRVRESDDPFSPFQGSR